MGQSERAEYVQLLGATRVRASRAWLAFSPEKRYQLLAYLAYSGDWVSRERLAYLFWPDTSTEKAQQNLRQLLHRIRSLKWISDLEVEAQRLRWPIETDVGAFRQALEQGKLDEALSLYTGPLLENLESDEAPEFSSWLEREREHLHALWRDALLRRVRESQERGKHGDAAKLLKVVLERDPLDEEALAAYLSAASLAGQREEALRAYDDFTSRLQDELGLEPTSTTQSVAQAIAERDDERLVEMSPVPPRSSTLSVSPFPTPATSFVGRDLELSEIAHLLAKAECRLLTLTGPGGIGKTRLALRAAEELAGRYSDGSSFVALSSLGSPEAIASTVAQALELELSGQDEPLAQLVRAIGNKHMLLVLDNYEHLLEGAPLASRLVQACPKLDVLVTSRERLDLAEEWLLAIEGLPFPIETTTTSKETLASDAMTLFTQRASQVRPTFIPSGEDLRHIVEICRLVEGSPLALELAAVWVRMMSCKEIAEEIQANIDILSSSSRSLPERHKSLRATFEHSWKLLSPVERKVLRKLSVFKGGFKREAASVVAGASIAVLASLVDKSLLRVTNRRYDQHPLLYQFTEEKLSKEAEEPVQVKQKHGAYYLGFLETWDKEAMARNRMREAHAALEEELENILVAWNWSIANHRIQEVHQASARLRRFHAMTSRYQAGAQVLARALAGLDQADPTHHTALGSVMVDMGFLCLNLGDYHQAAGLAERGTSLLRPAGNAYYHLWLGRILLGDIFAQVGDWPQAQERYQEALDYIGRWQDFTSVPVPTSAANIYNNLALAEQALGNYAQAEQYVREALATHQQLGIEHYYLVESLGYLGSLLLQRGQLEEAELPLQQGLQLARQLDLPTEVCSLLGNLALLSHERQDDSKAKAFCQEALQLVREGAERSMQASVRAEVLTTVGRASTALGEHAEALDYLTESLKLAWAIKAVPVALYALVGMAELRARQACAEQAVELLHLVLNHPATTQWVKDQAKRQLRVLEEETSPKVWAKALERGKAMTLEEVIERILRQPPLHP